MKIRAAVTFRFTVKISVLDVHAHRQAHVGISRQLLAARELFRRPVEGKDDGVFASKHFRAQFNFHRAAVASVRHKMPDGGRTGGEGGQIFEIQRRQKTVGIHPDAEAFHKNMAIHRHGWMQVCAERAIVFGSDAAEIHAKPRHAAAPVGQ